MPLSRGNTRMKRLATLGRSEMSEQQVTQEMLDEQTKQIDDGLSAVSAGITQLQAENERLKALNGELVAALHDFVTTVDAGFAITKGMTMMTTARGLLAKADQASREAER